MESTALSPYGEKIQPRSFLNYFQRLSRIEYPLNFPVKDGHSRLFRGSPTFKGASSMLERAGWSPKNTYRPLEFFHPMATFLVLRKNSIHASCFMSPLGGTEKLVSGKDAPHVFQQDEQMHGVGGGRDEIEMLIKAPCFLILGVDCESADADNVGGLEGAKHGIP